MSMSRGLYGCVFLFSLVHCSGVRAQVAPSSSWSLPNCMTNTLGAAIVGAADLIDDGAIEVLGVDLIANTLEILHVDSSGWTSIASHSVASGPVAAVAGDIDGDGDIDLAVSCRGVDPATNQIIPVVTLLRATVGGFARTDLPCPWLLTDGRLALEDLDGDGDQDLVFGSQAVVMNLGSAGFATQATFPLGALAPGARVLFADLDGDGDQDFLRWVPAPSGPAIIEWLSQGPTGVVATATFSLVHPLDDLALGDFDGDGNT
ncbi:MAG: VCBS repeat-containing protein, partial [Planctomycetes bacterium]|nr:VCBS repeat-containing protein [Planctomycetota bacterium]